MLQTVTSQSHLHIAMWTFLQVLQSTDYAKDSSFGDVMRVCDDVTIVDMIDSMTSSTESTIDGSKSVQVFDDEWI